MTSVQVYRRPDYRGGGTVAAIHTPRVHGEILAEDGRAATVIAKYLGYAAAELEGGGIPLVLPADEYAAVRAVMAKLERGK